MFHMQMCFYAESSYSTHTGLCKVIWFGQRDKMTGKTKPPTHTLPLPIRAKPPTEV